MERDLFKEAGYLSKEALKKLPTHRLLAYYKSKREGFLRERYYHYSEERDFGIKCNDSIELKYQKDVDDYVAFIKSLLDSKEHVKKKIKKKPLK